MIEDLETIDKWLKEEYGLSYTELVQEFNGVVELNIKYLNKIAQKDTEIERLNKENNILKENAEHNDKVVDNVNWENMILKEKDKEKDKEIERLNSIIHKALHLVFHNDVMDYRVFEENLKEILKGDPDE